MLETLMSRSGLKRDPAWSRWVLQWLGLSFVLHLIASVRTTGFYQLSEHFQILELVNFKLGRNPLENLPIEFSQQTLPWFLPAFFTLITRFLDAIGASNPFEWALMARVISTCVGWLSVAGLMLTSYSWFNQKKWRNLVPVILAVLWFIPALHSRPSGENWGGSLFFLGFSVLLLGMTEKAKKTNLQKTSALLGGFLLGLAFECYFPILGMIVGLFIWLVAIARLPILSFIPFFLGTGISLSIGALCDRWGYGVWTFVPHNYWNAHTSWHWDFLKEQVSDSWFLLKWLPFLSLPIAWFRHPKHSLTWTQIFFLLTLGAVGVTESNSLLPLVYGTGMSLLLAISPPYSTVFSKTRLYAAFERLSFRPQLRWGIHSLIGLNLLALISMSFFPVWMPIRFYERLYHFHPYGFEIYSQDVSLFQLGPKQMTFYRPSDLAITQFHQYDEFIQALQKKEKTLWLLQPESLIPNEAGPLKEWCRLEFSTQTGLPSWLEKLHTRNVSRSPASSDPQWTLYRCQSPSLLKSTLQETEGGSQEPAGDEN